MRPMRDSYRVLTPEIEGPVPAWVVCERLNLIAQPNTWQKLVGDRYRFTSKEESDGAIPFQLQLSVGRIHANFTGSLYRITGGTRISGGFDRPTLVLQWLGASVFMAGFVVLLLVLTSARQGGTGWLAAIVTIVVLVGLVTWGNGTWAIRLERRVVEQLQVAVQNTVSAHPPRLD
jgi:hypothetical protein